MSNPYTYNASSTGAAASMNVAVPGTNPMTAGDMLVVNVWSSQAVTKVTDTVGNSYLLVNGGGAGPSQWVTVGQTKKTTGNITVTLASSGSGNVVVVGLPSSIVWYGGVDAFASGSGSGTAVSFGSLAPTSGFGSYAIATIASAASTPTWTGGWTGFSSTSHGSSSEFLGAAWAPVLPGLGVTATVSSGAWSGLCLTVQSPIWTLGTPPVPPTQYAGTLATSDDMNALAESSMFLRRPPMALAHATATQSLTGGSQAAITWDRLLRDTDGFWVSGFPARLTVQTPGFYKVRYSIPFNVAGVNCQTVVKTTTGSNNPGGAGVSVNWWYADGAAAHSLDGCVAGGGIIPVYMFPLDYIEIEATLNTTSATSITPNLPQVSLRMVSN